MNLAAFRVPVSEFRNSGESESGGSFFDRINTINKISLFSLPARNALACEAGGYPEHRVSEFRNSEAILSKKWNFLYYRIKGGRLYPKLVIKPRSDRLLN